MAFSDILIVIFCLSFGMDLAPFPIFPFPPSYHQYPTILLSSSWFHFTLLVLRIIQVCCEFLLCFKSKIFFIKFYQISFLIQPLTFSLLSLPNENQKIPKVQILTEMFLMRSLLKKKSWQLLKLKDQNEFQIVPLSTQAWGTFTSNFFLLSMYHFHLTRISMSMCIFGL